MGLCEAAAEGAFRWPEAVSEGRVAMSHEALTLLLHGIDLSYAQRRKWYRKVPARALPPISLSC